MHLLQLSQPAFYEVICLTCQLIVVLCEFLYKQSVFVNPAWPPAFSPGSSFSFVSPSSLVTPPFSSHCFLYPHLHLPVPSASVPY